MGYQELRKMPVQTFWMLSKNVDRILAERDQRAARIGWQIQSGDGFKDLMANLEQQVGTVVVRDEGKLAMANAKRDVLSDEDKAALNAIGRPGKKNVRPRRT